MVPSPEWSLHTNNHCELNNFNLARKDYANLHQRVKRLGWQVLNNYRADSIRKNIENTQEEQEIPALVIFDNIWFDFDTNVFQGIHPQISCKALGLQKLDGLIEYKGCLSLYWNTLKVDFSNRYIKPLKDIQKNLVAVSNDILRGLD
jgi:hypothetical protein